jgi:prepilin peptidase CpaA
MRPAVEALLVLVALAAGFFDLRERRVPNWLTLAALIAGIAVNLALAHRPGLWTSLEGLGLALLIYLPLYLLRGVGGGDLKLMAAIGAIVGPIHWFWIWIFTALLGGVAALVLVIAKGRLRATLANVWAILTSLARGRAPHLEHPDLDVRRESTLRLPHGVVIAAATLIFLLARK